MKIRSKHHKHKKELKPLYVYINETEKNRRKDYERFTEQVSEQLSIPKDVIAGQARISLIGNHCIRVGNYRNMEEYSTECVKVSLGKKSLVIKGSHLLIEYFRKDEIKIIGNILNISFDS